MKKRLTFLVALFFVGLTLAQTDSIAVLHDYQENEGMRLKWLPASKAVFLAGCEYGYNVYRAGVLQENGNEVLGDFVKLNEEALKFWPEEKISAAVQKDSSLALAGFIVGAYEEYKQQEISEDLDEAYARYQSEEMMFMLYAFSAVGNNHFAEALGWFFTDKTAQLGKKYLYKIEVNHSQKFTSYLLIQSVKPANKMKVLDAKAELQPGRIVLSWFDAEQMAYPYYTIYRSLKRNGLYEKRNEMPYIPQKGGAFANDQRAVFEDTISEFGKTYYYKIKGIDYFGNEGPDADILEIKADYLLTERPVITKSRVLNNNEVELLWEHDLQEQKYTKGFNVYRATHGAGTYFKVNEKLLSPKSRNFTDATMKPNSNYYVVSAVGTAGDSLLSVSKMQLLLDSIPPDVPKGLVATCDTNGAVSLSWELNSEEDLRAYRLFKSYDRNTEWLRVFPHDTLATQIMDSVNLKMPYNKIYYRIFAMDQHYNASNPAEIEVVLPDINKPTSGFIMDYEVGMKGIKIHWVNSAAFDLAKMHLLRKRADESTYQILLTTSGPSLKTTTYLDTQTVSLTTYHYVVQAEDHAGLLSDFSKVFEIEQLDKRKIPAVQNLQAVSDVVSSCIHLTWQFPGNALGFRVYRAKKGERLKTLTFLQGDVREFLDKSVKPDNEYEYVFVAELEGGYSSGYSEKVNVKF